MKRKSEDFGGGENSVTLHERSYFWAHAGWSDDKGSPWGIVSPRCQTPSELKLWTSRIREKYGQEDGFALSPYKHNYLVDDQGHGIPGTGSDVSLLTAEEAVAPPWVGGAMAPLDFIKKVDQL